jgi:hypothetical protein
VNEITYTRRNISKAKAKTNENTSYTELLKYVTMLIDADNNIRKVFSTRYLLKNAKKRFFSKYSQILYTLYVDH